MNDNNKRFVLSPFYYSYKMERENLLRDQGDELAAPRWSDVTDTTLGPTSSKAEVEKWLRDQGYFPSSVFLNLWLSHQHDNVAFVVEELSPLPIRLEF